jgi:hypothetical protein
MGCVTSGSRRCAAQIGAAESDWDRISDVIPPPPLPFDLEALGLDS